MGKHKKKLRKGQIKIMPLKEPVTYFLCIRDDKTNTLLNFEVISKGFLNYDHEAKEDYIPRIYKDIQQRINICTRQFPNSKLDLTIDIVSNNQIICSRSLVIPSGSIYSNNQRKDFTYEKIFQILQDLDVKFRQKMFHDPIPQSEIRILTNAENRPPHPSPADPHHLESDQNSSFSQNESQQLDFTHSQNISQPEEGPDDLEIVILSSESNDEQRKTAPLPAAFNENHKSSDALSIQNYTGVYPVKVILREEALGKAWKHAQTSMNREVGGVLLGQFNYHSIDSVGKIEVYVSGIVQAVEAVSRSSTLNFTPEAWATIWKAIDNHPVYSQKPWAMVGWYHTHPGFGIFLSSYDVSIHQGHFRSDGHLALVIDPINNQYGFFCWDPAKKRLPLYRNELIVKLDDHQIQEKLRLSELPESMIAAGV